MRHRILFVHIAKTGGTSVRAALRPLRWTDPYSIPIYMGNHIARATKYRTGCKLHRHGKAITAKDMLSVFYDELFKFSFVRNPWDLHVSSWLHVRRMKNKPLGSDLEFPEFLKLRFSTDRPRSYSLDALAEPQTRFLTDFDGNLIVDFVGRFERLEEDFEEVCRLAQLRKLSLPHRRKAKNRRDYRTYYSDALAEFVAEKHASDIDRFGYTFDPEDD